MPLHPTIIPDNISLSYCLPCPVLQPSLCSNFIPLLHNVLFPYRSLPPLFLFAFLRYICRKLKFAITRNDYVVIHSPGPGFIASVKQRDVHLCGKIIIFEGTKAKFIGNYIKHCVLRLNYNILYHTRPSYANAFKNESSRT